MHRLEWANAGEQLNASFNLQYSKTGTQFETVKSIPAQFSSGLSYSTLHYSAEYRPAAVGQHYYRLESVDREGRTLVCSKVLNWYEGDAPSTVSIYPNPSHDLLYAEVESKNEGIIGIKVINVYGQILRHEQEKVRAGMHTITLDLHDLQSGIYMLQWIGYEGLLHRQQVRISR